MTVHQSPKPTILRRIAQNKLLEVAFAKSQQPLASLRQRPSYQRTTNSLRKALSSASGIGLIAEFKRQTPSGGKLYPGDEAPDPVAVVRGFRQVGAVAASILTDRQFFGGELDHLEAVREALPDFPLLAKDFIIDPYQIHQAKAYGADAVVFIADLLSTQEIDAYLTVAHELGLEVILQISGERDYDVLRPNLDMIMVNSRNLVDFTVDLPGLVLTANNLPEGPLKIAASGLENHEWVPILHKVGYRGFLVGTYFMQAEDPVACAKSYLEAVRW